MSAAGAITTIYYDFRRGQCRQWYERADGLHLISECDGGRTIAAVGLFYCLPQRKRVAGHGRVWRRVSLCIYLQVYLRHVASKDTACVFSKLYNLSGRRAGTV